MNLDESLQALTRLRGCSALLISGQRITRGLAYDVIDMMGDRRFDGLDVVLQTGGGDIDAAFILAKKLRTRAKRLSIFVPIGAKSAGTLICLAADEIIMSDHAELGPLDAQMFEQKERGEGQYKSVLNSFKGLERAQMTPHLFEKIDMKEMGEYDRMLQIGERYGETLLTRYRGVARPKAREIIERLVYGYPSHGYVIDIDELADIGLPVQAMNASVSRVLAPLANELLDAENDVVHLCDFPTSDSLLTAILHNVAAQKKR